MIQTPSSFIPLLAPVASDNPLTFLFRGSELLVLRDSNALPEVHLLNDIIADSQLHAVGSLDGRYCQTAFLAPDLPLPDTMELRNMRALWGEMDEGLLGVAGRAAQIAEWSRSHRYCGVCATPMVAVAGEHCYQCPACQHSVYPRISPAMMVLVRKGHSILLARHGRAPQARYTALAGFVEAGESVEQTVHREVFEEVGLKIHQLKYFASQSWPFPHSLMIAFTAEYLSGDIVIDGKEIVDARWFGPGEELPLLATKVSIASALINAHLPR